jgi:hypothetical protein
MRKHKKIGKKGLSLRLIDNGAAVHIDKITYGMKSKETDA